MTEKDPSEREWLKKLVLLPVTAIVWFAGAITSEVVGGRASDTAFGQLVGRIILITGIVVAPLVLVGWLVWYLRNRKRGKHDPDDERPPEPVFLEPPVWYRREPLCDRDTEVREAVALVRANGVVTVVGPRDFGTSAVGQAVVQKLIDAHGGENRTTFRFDLRSRDVSGPDDAMTTAGRVVSAFGIDQPADDTEEVLTRVARELVDRFRESGGTLMLDNVTNPDQVRWLVQEWPAGERPRLVIAGETAIREVIERSTVEVGPLEIRYLEEIWHAELDVPEPSRARSLRDRIANFFGGHDDSAEKLAELLRACVGRPRAVKALAQEIRRPGSNVTLESLLAQLRSDGPVEGPLERVWGAILANIRSGVTAKARWLLLALAVLPVTGLTKSTIAALLGGDEPKELEELRIRNLVEEVDGRYRLPQEIRRVIVRVSSEDERRAVAREALPKLVRYYADYATKWAVRLDVDTVAARNWFTVSEPSFRPLFSSPKYLDDELLELVLDDLCAIADALDRWYVRERQPAGLLAVNEGLHPLVERAGRPDLAALCAIRMATAHRMVRRLGDAAAKLDLALSHTLSIRDARVRASLDAREQVERALLAMTGMGPAADDALRELDRLRTVTKANLPTVLINLAALRLGAGHLDEALEDLLTAEELALDQRDYGCQAHAVELQGVVLSQRNLVEAVRAWQLACSLFKRIGEDQGEARCLQHLGAAAVTDTRAAGQLAHGSPVRLTRREAAEVALKYLLPAKALRAGQHDTTLVDHYIAKAREALAS